MGVNYLDKMRFEQNYKRGFLMDLVRCFWAVNYRKYILRIFSKIIKN